MNMTTDQEIIGAVLGLYVEYCRTRSNHKGGVSVAAAEGKLAAKVKELSIWPELSRIPGMDPGGFGVLLGEFGNLDDYTDLVALWRQAGLARSGLARSGDSGVVFSPGRRAAVYLVTTPVLRAKKSKNPYRCALERRQRFEWHQYVAGGVDGKRRTSEQRAARATRRATRHASKRLLADIWRLWTGEIDSINLASNATT